MSFRANPASLWYPNTMKRRHKQPTTLDLIQATRNVAALEALMRRGGGPHADKRRSKERRTEWKRQVEW